MDLKFWSLGIGAWVALSAVSLAQTPSSCQGNCNCGCKCSCCQTEHIAVQEALTADAIAAKDFVLTKRKGCEWCCHVAVPQLSVDPKIASEYPGLAKGIQTFNGVEREEAQALLNKFAEALSSVSTDRQPVNADEWQGERFRYYEAAVDAVRLDSQAVSFQEIFSIYTGGAHGEYGLLGYTFDPVSGKVITLDDLIANKDALREYINESLQKKYPDAAFFGREEQLYELFSAPQNKESTKNIVDHHWVMTATGLVFHFNPYEVASYADGLLSVEVDANGCLELFRPEARQRYFEKNRTGAELVKPKYLRPAELEQLVGKWHLVSGEIEGSKATAQELGIDCQVEVNLEGVAHLVYKDNNSTSSNRDMSVRVVATPLYDGCPQEEWSAHFFDAQGDREFQATVLPDGTLRMLVFSYDKHQEYPQVFCGDFVRE